MSRENWASSKEEFVDEVRKDYIAAWKKYKSSSYYGDHLNAMTVVKIGTWISKNFTKAAIIAPLSLYAAAYLWERIHLSYYGFVGVVPSVSTAILIRVAFPVITLVCLVVLIEGTIGYFFSHQSPYSWGLHCRYAVASLFLLPVALLFYDGAGNLVYWILGMFALHIAYYFIEVLWEMRKMKTSFRQQLVVSAILSRPWTQFYRNDNGNDDDTDDGVSMLWQDHPWVFMLVSVLPYLFMVGISASVSAYTQKEYLSIYYDSQVWIVARSNSDNTYLIKVDEKGNIIENMIVQNADTSGSSVVAVRLPNGIKHFEVLDFARAETSLGQKLGDEQEASIEDRAESRFQDSDD